jgi:hypothetical protein
MLQAMPLQINAQGLSAPAGSPASPDYSRALRPGEGLASRFLTLTMAANYTAVLGDFVLGDGFIGGG